MKETSARPFSRIRKASLTLINGNEDKYMKIKTILVALAVTLTVGHAHSASQDECAIWICAPGGFPAGCGAAKAAMISRVKDLKPPLPAFSACAVNPPVGSGSHMTAAHGRAAYIPARRVCTRWSWSGDNERCLNYEWQDAYYIKNTTCQIRDGDSTPQGCTKTDRFIEVYIEGQLAGPTYYWNF